MDHARGAAVAGGSPGTKHGTKSKLSIRHWHASVHVALHIVHNLLVALQARQREPRTVLEEYDDVPPKSKSAWGGPYLLDLLVLHLHLQGARTAQQQAAGRWSAGRRAQGVAAGWPTDLALQHRRVGGQDEPFVCEPVLDPEAPPDAGEGQRQEDECGAQQKGQRELGV